MLTRFWDLAYKNTSSAAQRSIPRRQFQNRVHDKRKQLSKEEIWLIINLKKKKKSSCLISFRQEMMSPPDMH